MPSRCSCFSSSTAGVPVAQPREGAPGSPNLSPRAFRGASAHFGPDVLHLLTRGLTASAVVEDVLSAPALFLNGRLRCDDRPRPILGETSTLDEAAQLQRLG